MWLRRPASTPAVAQQRRSRCSRARASRRRRQEGAAGGRKEATAAAAVEDLKIAALDVSPYAALANAVRARPGRAGSAGQTPQMCPVGGGAAARASAAAPLWRRASRGEERKERNSSGGPLWLKRRSDAFPCPLRLPLRSRCAAFRRDSGACLTRGTRARPAPARDGARPQQIRDGIPFRPLFCAPAVLSSPLGRPWPPGACGSCVHCMAGDGARGREKGGGGGQRKEGERRPSPSPAIVPKPSFFFGVP